MIWYSVFVSQSIDSDDDDVWLMKSSIKVFYQFTIQFKHNQMSL